VQQSLKTIFWNYDRTLPLVDKRVEIVGYTLDIEIQRPEITFGRTFAGELFDVAEMSLSNAMTAASKGRLNYLLIPVFLSRAFRHSSIFVRTDRGIHAPRDLKGKIVGLQEYDMTAAVVVRGFLRDQYGVEPGDIRWRVGDLERAKPLEFCLGKPPQGVDIELLTADQSLEDRLVSGELDAVISLRPLATLPAKGSKIAPLFADPVAEEAAWFRASGHFPIMHAVGVRKSLLDADRSLGRQLFEAFLAAKTIAVSEMEVTQAQKITLPWPHRALAEARSIFGADHWPYGIVANRLALENQIRWSRLDGLQERPVALEELFDPECMDT
jgi:4,5-dihydroxyphthalate decarboxylase